jgi:Glycogen debranching enzyme N terminal
MIQFKQETCSDLEAALSRECLETNGLGGYASSTIIGLNTRRYHDLLVAATRPPVGRMVLPLENRRNAGYRWEALRSVGQSLFRCYSPAGISLSQTVSPQPVSSLYV